MMHIFLIVILWIGIVIAAGGIMVDDSFHQGPS